MNLVEVKNKQVVTSSLKVAHVFGKAHRSVMKRVRNLAAQNYAAKSWFMRGFYINRGRQYPLFYMNRNGFSLLVMGFTGQLANNFKVEYIQAFNDMEKQLNGDPVAKAQQIAHNAVANPIPMVIDLLKKYQSDHPKAKMYDATMNNPQLFSITKIAKDIGMSGKTLNMILQQKGIIYHQDRSWNLYSKYQNCGYAHYRYYSNDSFPPLLKWTQRGRQFIYDTLGIHPSKQLSLGRY